MGHPTNKYERFEIGKKKGKRRTQGFLGPMSRIQDENERLAIIERSEHVRRNTGQPCSCYLCGNPRKHTQELSMQEKRAEMHFEDTLSSELDRAT